jgi:hypothetical protein
MILLAGATTMNDEELLTEAAGLQTVYFDGFGAFRKINGVLRCVGYVLDTGAQMNLIVSLAGAEASIAEVQRVLDEKPSKNGARIKRLSLAH